MSKVDKKIPNREGPEGLLGKETSEEQSTDEPIERKKLQFRLERKLESWYLDKSKHNLHPMNL